MNRILELAARHKKHRVRIKNWKRYIREYPDDFVEKLYNMMENMILNIKEFLEKEREKESDLNDEVKS